MASDKKVNSVVAIGPTAVATGAYMGAIGPTTGNSSIYTNGAAVGTYADGIEALKQYTVVPPSTMSAASESVGVINNTASESVGVANTAEEKAEEKPVSYEEYLEEQKQLLEKRKTEADRQAELARERAAVDAQASYAQNMATYGSNAETLAQMGLQGGGYSDYINAQSYAQKRADIQQANATELLTKTQNTATYEDALSDLNLKGIEYKEKQAESKKGYYAELLAYANNGSYTAEQLKQLGSEYGLDETQIGSLADAAAQYKQNKQNDTYNALASNFMGSVNYIKNAYNNGDISEEQYKQLTEFYQRRNFEEYLTEISGDVADADCATVDRAYANGDISEEQYNALKSKWNEDIDISAIFKNPNGSGNADYSYAKVAYENVVNNSWCADGVKSSLEAKFKEIYAVDIAKESLGQMGYDTSKITSNIVDVTSSTYTIKSWGNYSGLGSNGTQDALVRAYVKAAEEGEIEIGKICKFNYGNTAGDSGYFIYIGEGKFIKYDYRTDDMKKNKDIYESKCYTPAGYKWSVGGSIKKA